MHIFVQINEKYGQFLTILNKFNNFAISIINLYY